MNRRFVFCTQISNNSSQHCIENELYERWRNHRLAVQRREQFGITTRKITSTESVFDQFD